MPPMDRCGGGVAIGLDGGGVWALSLRMLRI
jgi:hypothetical protein